jgi:hypothetical protein
VTARRSAELEIDKAAFVVRLAARRRSLRIRISMQQGFA